MRGRTGELAGLRGAEPDSRGDECAIHGHSWWDNRVKRAGRAGNER